ncbi:MAG: hypothetical protein ACHQQS_13050 [Thermoanaerobaculales bacterium]
MALSVLLYAGLVVAAAGFLSVLYPLRWLGIRTRRAGALVLAAGLAAAVFAVSWPTPTQHVATPRTRLDAIMPEYQFAEFHETRVHASPDRVMAAARAVTPGEIRFFATLMQIRALPARLLGKLPPRPQQPPKPTPLLELFLRGGFVMLAEGDDEIVFGEVGRFWHAAPTSAGIVVRDAADFESLQAPGIGKVAANLRVDPDGDGWTRLTTETRVAATDAAARRAFAIYWRLIYPGSSLIRTTWLAAIRQRAEHSTAPD